MTHTFRSAMMIARASIVSALLLLTVGMLNHSCSAQETDTSDDPRASRKMPKREGDITFDDLKFEIEKDGKFSREMITESIENLDGKVVRLRGFILPASVMQLKNIKKFVLVRDNKECCFGPGAALYDCVIVQMQGDLGADFTTRPVAVKGKFKIKEFKYPGDEGHYAIYELEGVEVK